MNVPGWTIPVALGFGLMALGYLGAFIQMVKAMTGQREGQHEGLLMILMFALFVAGFAVAGLGIFLLVARIVMGG